MKIHADDFGLNGTVNQNIKNLLSENKLSTVSILANFSTTNEAGRIIKKFLQIPVFLHFNLVEGKSLSSVSRSLSDVSGRFYNKSTLIYKILTGQIRSKEIERELELQLTTLGALGIKVSGIDSHQHLHALSPIAEIVFEIAKKNNMPFIRSYTQMKSHTLFGTYKLQLLKNLARTSYLRTYGKYKLPITWQIKKWQSFSVGSWEKINRNQIKKNETIVLHPGTNYDRNQNFEINREFVELL